MSHAPIAATTGSHLGLSPTESSICPAASAASNALLACAAFLNGLPDWAYTRPSAVMHHATIGQHTRHALDHYHAALRGSTGGVIDYDHRERGTAIETERGAALSAIDAIRDALARVDRPRAEEQVHVIVMVDSDSGRTVELGSTLGREIAFAAHHAVHHHAMMSAIAREFGLPVPDGFEKAPSTLHHERTSRP